MRNLLYKPEAVGGQLTLSLFSEDNPIPIWQNRYPAFTENAEDGELQEDLTLIELGAMTSISDINGLRAHLIKIGVLQDDDQIQLKN